MPVRIMNSAIINNMNIISSDGVSNDRAMNNIFNE